MEFTPLHIAAQKGNDACCIALIDAGCGALHLLFVCTCRSFAQITIRSFALAHNTETTRMFLELKYTDKSHNGSYPRSYMSSFCEVVHLSDRVAWQNIMAHAILSLKLSCQTLPMWETDCYTYSARFPVIL